MTRLCREMLEELEPGSPSRSPRLHHHRDAWLRRAAAHTVDRPVVRGRGLLVVRHFDLEGRCT